MYASESMPPLVLHGAHRVPAAELEAHAAKARPRHEGRPGGHPIKRTGVRPHAISSGLVDA